MIFYEAQRSNQEEKMEEKLSEVCNIILSYFVSEALFYCQCNYFITLTAIDCVVEVRLHPLDTNGGSLENTTLIRTALENVDIVTTRFNGLICQLSHFKITLTHV